MRVVWHFQCFEPMFGRFELWIDFAFGGVTRVCCGASEVLGLIALVSLVHRSFAFGRAMQSTMKLLHSCKVIPKLKLGEVVAAKQFQ